MLILFGETLVFDFTLFVFHADLHAMRMNLNSSDNTGSRWQKTPVANLVRHVQSQNYYARIRVRGKLIWKLLKPDESASPNYGLAISTIRSGSAP